MNVSALRASALNWPTTTWLFDYFKSFNQCQWWRHTWRLEMEYICLSADSYTLYTQAMIVPSHITVSVCSSVTRAHRVLNTEVITRRLSKRIRLSFIDFHVFHFATGGLARMSLYVLADKLPASNERGLCCHRHTDHYCTRRGADPLS